MDVDQEEDTSDEGEKSVDEAAAVEESDDEIVPEADQTSAAGMDIDDYGMPRTSSLLWTLTISYQN